MGFGFWNVKLGAAALTMLILPQQSVGWPKSPYANLVGGRRIRCHPSMP